MRRALRTAAATFAYVALAVVVIDRLGIAGFRGGLPITALVLGAGAGLVAFLAMGSEPDRALWVLAVVVVAVVPSPALADNAPLSKGQLRRHLDRLELPLFRRLSHGESGRSWCTPSCPTVTRTYRAPPTAPRAAVATVAVALNQAKLIDDRALTRPPQDRLRYRTEDLLIDVSARPSAGQASPVLVTLTFTAHD